MSRLSDLIAKIENPELRAQIEEAANQALKQKKFGLVFEEHLPECTPLYDVPVRKGKRVSLKNGKVNETYTVLKIDGETAVCLPQDSKEAVELAVADLVVTAEFGEPIYPCLKPLGEVCNAPDSDLWHTLIEADNYHALQLLEYLYAGKVDCIYIDPPYNTGAKDWKYNNDYVDGSDEYRHSKWLSFMQKRLEIAKKLLNPTDSVLILTIDEKEYLHIGCLLEELFPEANIQMISTLTARSGAARFNSFSRVNEFIYFVMIGNYEITPIEDANYQQEGDLIHWRSFRRGNPANIRPSRPSQFYPLFVDISTQRIIEVGEPITPDVDRFSVKGRNNCITVFPVRDDGTEMMWSVTPNACRKLVCNGYIKATKYQPDKPQQFAISYLSSGTINDIETGKATVLGYSDNGGIIASNLESRKAMPKTQWMITCGCCGSHYRHKVNNSGKKWHSDIWVCARQERDGKATCESTRIKDSVLREKFIEAYNEFVTQRPQGDTIEKLQAEIQKIQKQEQELATLMLSKLLSEKDFRTEQRSIKVQIREIEEQIQEFQRNTVQEYEFTTITEFDETKIHSFLQRIIMHRNTVTFRFYNGVEIIKEYTNGQPGNKPGWNKKEV